MMSNPTNGNGGDAKIILNFTYSNGWPGSIEIPNVSAATLPGKLAAIVASLESAGCRPPAPLAAPATNGGPTNAPGSPPVCRYHGPMKPSKKHGGWYCSHKLADGSFCDQKIEA
jgi:hypothetical protein